MPEAVLDLVRHNPLPALIVELPSEQVVAASPAALELMVSDKGGLVDREVDSVFADARTGALELLAVGRLTSYETIRQLRLRDGSSSPCQTWVRTIGDQIPPRQVLFVFTPVGSPARTGGTSLLRDFGFLLGTTDVQLRIDRVKSDGDAISVGPSELLGQSIFQIVHHDDLAGLMWALAQATSTGTGVMVHIHVERAAERPQACQMLILPIDPLPSCAFSIVSVDQPEGSPDPETVDATGREPRGIDFLSVSRGIVELSEGDVPGISQLTSRELDVLTRLFAGHRVSAIAKTLFISQSTVRNHLSSVFLKLGVESQQELVELLIWKVGKTSSSK